ncbi:MAG: universal stress protein [Dehalococcoidales bacterium]|nr:universal stress protein [Dehalococcoidales bacterium]
MNEKILVPLDGSKTAEIVLPYAVEFVGRLGGQLILAKVSAPNSRCAEQLHRNYLAVVTEQVGQILNYQFGGKPAAVQGQVLTGNPSLEILRYSDDNNVGLIIMSGRDCNDDGPCIINCIAEKVLRAANQSVLLVKSLVNDRALQRKKLIKRILLPLDGSRIGEAAIPTAEMLGRLLDAELVLLHVVVPSSLQFDSFHGFITEELAELLDQAAKGDEERIVDATEYLGNVSMSLKEKGLTSSIDVISGYPPDQIVNYAEANDIDLIAMSSHGWSGVMRWAFGRVTNKVLHSGKTPVLMVRAYKMTKRNQNEKALFSITTQE